MAFTLTRDAWKIFKATNHLSKSPWYSRADVGPAIDKFHTAYDTWNKTPGYKTLASCVSKAVDLEKAFAKFITLKEAKDELGGPAKLQIQTWAGEARDAANKLRESYATLGKSKLKDQDARRMSQDLNGWFNL